jgi:hypothetical protein
MKKNDDTYKPSEDYALMDLLFAAGWEFGKANLTKDAGASLTLFKAGIKGGGDGVDTLNKLVKAGMKETDRLYAADAKKSAEMN